MKRRRTGAARTPESKPDKLQFALAVIFKIVEIITAPIWFPMKLLWRYWEVPATCIIAGTIIWGIGAALHFAFDLADNPSAIQNWLVMISLCFLGAVVCLFIVAVIIVLIMDYVKKHWNENYELAGRVLNTIRRKRT